MQSTLGTALTSLRATKPLIHNITNVVVTNFTANGMYAIGASPVMAYAKEEVADMASIAQGLMINIGTLTAPTVEAMFIAGEAANQGKTPIVFDPVGSGATPYRTNTAKKLLTELSIQVVRGNASEIASLIDDSVTTKGVDSDTALENAQEVAIKVAKEYNTIVAMTGEVDIVTDGSRVLTVSNGHPLQTTITGAGCLLSSLVAAFIASNDVSLDSIVAALATYGVAAEIAYKETPVKAPGSFQQYFLNALYEITEEDVNDRSKVEEVTS
ncbi:hydroxyethylthiazole kinase [Paenalkalicoccus suaedae]|uniref:Hydroxyethylthiazole kinase n=1 Tax=Paenalkalicoccus suaedae TaxID=2592382 RepID=A0A859FCG9_9BACI|nr:hydroxyethylthiazole kinase [Paenalkalicoccus suaedae]QKS70538.1 hydroxyethylthiazole kinase [Paenalkalicoccus suaedae]